MQLLLEPGGAIRAIYGELIDLSALGNASISRASHVEPEGNGWSADLSPVGGPKLGPFELRSSALSAELAWLEANWLIPAGRHD